MSIYPAVVPVLVGPLQVLLTLLPGLLVAFFGGVLGLFRPSTFKNTAKLLWRQKVAVLVLAGFATGVVYGARQLWPRGGAVVDDTVAGSDWSTARFDLRRRGVVPGTASPARRDLVWSFREGNAGFLASPAVVGNRVYIASADLGAFSKTGAIYCIHAESGKLVWKAAPENYRATFSSPVISDGYLVCGEGLHDTRDARVVCYRLHADREPDLLWTFRTNNHVESTPVIAAGRVYVGAGDDGYYCLDLEPAAPGQARLHWHKPGQDYPDAETALAVHDGKVYAGLGNNGKALVVLDAADGAELHRIALPYPVFSPPAIADGKLYLGMGNGDYVVSGEGGEVRCLALDTLHTEWSFPLPRTVLGAVAVTDDKLYFGCGDHHLYCLDRAGRLLHKFDAHGPIKTSPAVTDEHVFVVSDAGMLFALNRHTLEPVWDAFRLGNSGWFISSPVVAAGHVYVGTQNDGLFCIGQPSTEQPLVQWATPLGGPGRGGNADDSPPPDVGALHWKMEQPLHLPPAVVENTLLAPLQGPQRAGLARYLLQQKTPTAPAPDWLHATDQEIVRGPVVLDDTVAIVIGAHGTLERQLRLLRRDNGQLIKAHPVDSSASGVLTVTERHFLVQDQVGRLRSFDKSGASVWTSEVGRLLHPPASSVALILAAGPGAVLALDSITGAVLWRTEIAHATVAAPVLERSNFFLGTSAGIEKRSLVDGARDETWKAEGGVPSGELVLTNQRLVYINQQGEVVVVDRASGELKARVAGARVGATPLVSRGSVIYPAAERFMIFPIAEEDPFAEPWLELPAQAKEIVPHLLLREGQVYLSLGHAGLLSVGRAP